MNESQQSPLPNTSEEPAQKFDRILESSLTGVFKFVIRFLHTVWDMTFEPSAVIGDLSRSHKQPLYIRPFSFLALSSLLYEAADLFQPNYSDVIGSSILSSLESALAVKSPLAVMQKAFPGVLMTVIASIWISSVMFRNKSEARIFSIKLLCMSRGVQIMLYFITTLLYSCCIWYIKYKYQGSDADTSTLEKALGLIFLLAGFTALFFGAVPAIFSYLMGINAFREKKRSINRMYLMSVVASFVLVSAGELGSDCVAAIAYIKKLDKAAIGQSAEVNIHAELLSGTLSKQTGDLNLTLILKNRGDDVVFINPPRNDSLTFYGYALTYNQVQKEFERENEESEFRIIPSSMKWEGDSPVIKMEPGEARWLSVKFKKDTHEGLSFFGDAVIKAGIQDFAFKFRIEFESFHNKVHSTTVEGKIKIIDV